MYARWLLLGAVFGTYLTASAGDWPQWRGPNRDATVADFAAPKTWPKGLTKKWSVPVGGGVATPALVGDKLYTFSWQDQKEVTRCLNADTGKEIWKDSYSTAAAGGPAKGYPAARASPAVADGKVVTLGVQGVVSCLDAGTGKVLWRKDKTGAVPMFAASCSPLLVDGLCVVQVGGDRGGAAVVAYELATGNEKWSWKSDGTKYSSPVLLAVGGTKAVVAETSATVSAVSLDAGKLLWQTPFSSRYNAATPIVAGDVIVLGGSKTANKAVKVEKSGDKLTATELWSNKDNTVIYNTPAIRDGVLYGLSEGNEVFALDAASGKTLWSHPIGGKGGRPVDGYGSVVSAGPVLLALNPAGSLVVLEPRKDEYKELARYKVADGGTYAYPVVTGNRVYVKDDNALTLWTIE